MNRPEQPWRTKRYWRNLARFTFLIVSMASISVTLWLARTRAMILVHPVRTQPSRTPSDLGIITWDEVSFPSADGLLLGGWFIPPDPNNNGATLIFVHGLGSNRSESLDQAAMLAHHGYGALLFDLRNHGQSQGDVTTLGYAEVEDVRGAVAYLLTRPEVNPELLGLIGMSMGGGIVIRAAARIPEVRAVIAQSAFTSLEDNMAHGVSAVTGLPSFPFAPLVVWFGELETGEKIQQVRPIDDVGDISPRPILFIHGELDEVIPASNSLQLYQAAREPKQLYLIPNAGHGGFLETDPVMFELTVVRFFDTYLNEP